MHNQVVSRDEWLAARKQLLAKEKAFTRMRDELNAARRALPWVKLAKPYVFDTPDGPQTLADLFSGRSQLVVKHFMFGPDWTEGCVGCSFEIDHIGGALVHLEHHDVSYVVVSRAPLAKIEAFRRRMGWGVKWVSSCGSDFNYDFHVSFRPDELAKGEAYYNYEVRPVGIDELSGRSVFCKDEAGDIFHTYSAFARGGEMFLGTYAVLDITPKGRDETINGNLTDWVRHHDRYGDGGFVDPTGQYVAAGDADACCRAGEAQE
ncbi:MAG TPA: thioredoxin family protein [Acetobacteraceae bacterium]|nr:thioredoxin family protein [Acetobacteraceae bacterium]